MKKFFKVLINTMLIAVLVCAVGWYFVGDDLFEKALGNEKQVAAQTQETIVEKEVVSLCICWSPHSRDSRQQPRSGYRPPVRTHSGTRG